MNKLKSVFWDLDGTLADTELNGHRLAFNSAFKKFNLSWQWDIPTYIDLLRVTGGRNRIYYYSQLMNIKISKDQIKEIHFQKQSIYIDMIKYKKIKLRIGVNRLVQELYQHKIQQLVVTTSSRNTTIQLLSSLFNNYNLIFMDIVTGDDVVNLKPSPDAYSLALSKSNSSIYNSIVIEDSVVGLKSANALGLKCIVSLSPWLKSMTNDFSKAEYVVDHLGDFDLPLKVFKGNLISNIVDLNIIQNLTT